MKYGFLLRRFDIGLDFRDTVKQVAVTDNVGAKLRSEHCGIDPFDRLKPVADVFFDVPEIGKRLGLCELVGGFRERKSGVWLVPGFHGEMQVKVERNIATLATCGNRFCRSWIGFDSCGLWHFCEAVCCHRATEKIAPPDDFFSVGNGLRETAGFVPKLRLGEMYATKYWCKNDKKILPIVFLIGYALY